MIIIPGFLIALLTFPGVVVHEAGHMLFCRLFKLAIFDVCFLRVGNPAGYVIHEEPTSFAAAFFSGMGPFFLNTLLAIVFCLPAFVPCYELEVVDPLAWFFYWLGISIGAHAFPSPHDLNNIWAQAGPAVKRGNVLALVSYPIVGALYVANALRFFWLDVLYGVGVGVLVPLAIFRAVAG